MLPAEAAQTSVAFIQKNNNTTPILLNLPSGGWGQKAGQYQLKSLSLSLPSFLGQGKQPQVGGLLCPEAEAPPGAREQALCRSTPGAFCRCPDSAGPGSGEANQLETQLMSLAVLIPSAEMLVQVPQGPRHCFLILLRLTQMDDYFFLLPFPVSQWVRNKAVVCRAPAMIFLKSFCIIQLTPATAAC